MNESKEERPQKGEMKSKRLLQILASTIPIIKEIVPLLLNNYFHFPHERNEGLKRLEKEYEILKERIDKLEKRIFIVAIFLILNFILVFIFIIYIILEFKKIL